MGKIIEINRTRRIKRSRWDSKFLWKWRTERLFGRWRDFQNVDRFEIENRFNEKWKLKIRRQLEKKKIKKHAGITIKIKRKKIRKRKGLPEQNIKELNFLICSKPKNGWKDSRINGKERIKTMGFSHS